MNAPPLLVEELTDNAAVEALRPEWSALWQRCPSATPFQSPQWLLPWWRLFGNGRPLVLALRREGALAGLLPLFLFQQEQGPRQLSLWGSGITDYLDMLIEPAIAPAGAGMLLDYLAAERSRWDLCEFRDLRPESSLLSAPFPPELCAEVSPGEVCPVLPLPGTVEAFRAGLSTGFRKQLRYTLGSLGRRGEARVETATAETLPGLLDALFRLHARAWQQRGESGVLGDERLQAFHRAAAEGLLAEGRLRLKALSLEGERIAVLYAFAARGRLYYYLGGFDPALARLSPGALILWRTIEQAIEEEMGEFDFLRGGESYKYRWGARDRPTYRLRLRSK